LSPEKRREQLDVIQRATQNLSNLVEDVLLLGKVEAGKLQFQPEPLDVIKLCRNLVDEVLSATNRQCPIQFSHNGPLEGVKGDETLLRPIIVNLLTNAVKYSSPGSPVEFTVTRLTLQLAPAGEAQCGGGHAIGHAVERGGVQFTIRDRGIGIPPEDQRKLFEAFTRGNNVGERPGTGLGLVIVKRCVELHGGSIRLESAPDKGTVVNVCLPMIDIV
jgi:signal transduction histidine kinase